VLQAHLRDPRQEAARLGVAPTQDATLSGFAPSQEAAHPTRRSLATASPRSMESRVADVGVCAVSSILLLRDPTCGRLGTSTAASLDGKLVK